MRGLIIVAIFLCSCKSTFVLQTLAPQQERITGYAFYKKSVAFNWKQRDSFAVKELLSGNMPQFLKRFVPVTINMQDSTTGRAITATFYVMPDYLSIGTDEDWARLPLTPMAAQQIADTMQCFLPTRKLVNDIYNAAVVKLEPVPMYAFRDSTPTMWQHHLIIEGQRKGRSGLIAGIKKDVVISGKVSRDPKPNRVAIYGWHKPDGKPIQPLYTGHVNWYVDYSHGIRLIHREIKVDGKWIDYQEVLKNAIYRKMLCDENDCDFYRYPY